MSTTTKPPAVVPASNVVPFAAPPMPSQMWSGWGGGAPPGCCPSCGGGMGNLMQCYCDVQAAQAFICQMMINCVQTNPAVTAAIIAAIEASGSSLPLLGVTNGSAAQPGQVGEFINLSTAVSFPVTASYAQPVTLGVLQPGDWNCWAYLGQSVLTTGSYMTLNPVPAGFSNVLAQELAGPGLAEATVLVAPACEALISVPTLIAFTLTTNTGGAGTAGNATLFFSARRCR